MRRFVKTVLVLAVSALVLVLAGCTRTAPKTPGTDGVYPVYYCVVNKNATAMTRVEYTYQSASKEARIAELLQKLTEDNSDAGQYAVVPGSIRIEDWTLSEEGELNLSFNGEYYALSSVREAVLRAGVVLTLTQLENVRSVSFTVNGEPLVQHDQPVGPMVAAMFANHIGEPTEVKNVTLCFLSGAKNGLVAVDRLVFPDDYKPMEEYLLEFLIAGPTEKEISAEKQTELQPLSGIPSGTKILHLVTKKSTCYVDLSKEFMDSDKSIAPVYILHSIADTLIRNFDYIDGVVISVEGKVLSTYRDTEVPSIFRTADLLQPKNQ